MSFVSVREINQKKSEKEKKRFRPRPAHPFFGVYVSEKHAQKRQNFAPKRLLRKKRNRGRLLASTS
jgi:hypothetical protein